MEGSSNPSFPTTRSTPALPSPSLALPPFPQDQLWVDKYKPTTISQMCYPVFANKLKDWLINFYDAAEAGDFEPKQPRGVLLSGPPGIGKTTTVHVVASELGLTVVEYNASDFRSKKSLHERVSDMTTNKGFAHTSSSSIVALFPSSGSTAAKETGCAGGPEEESGLYLSSSSTYCTTVANDAITNTMKGPGRLGAARYGRMLLLMDEVDGCDIGGVGEIISMLKTTKVPIMCTCNDRWHPKLRSLLNHVEDMRLSRPPCHIVANFLYDRVLAREGVSLSKPLLQTIVQQSGSDIRSMLNNLQMWSLHKPRIEQRELTSYAAQSSKNGEAGLFEAAEYFLLQGTSRGDVHSLEDMEKVYYNADLIDMFVQENYLHYNPFGTSSTGQGGSFVDRQRMGETSSLSTPEGRSGSGGASASFYALPSDSVDSWMSAVQVASDAISRADAAHKTMYMDQNWSVSRAYVLLGSILPCAVTRGKYESFCTGQQVFFDRQRPVKFPSWLGHNSTTGKNKRLLRCVAAQATHPLHGMSGGGEDMLLDYIPLGLAPRLTRPLLSSTSFAAIRAASSSVSSAASLSPSMTPTPLSTSKSSPRTMSSNATPTEGIEEVLQTMEQYHLLRDDWDYVVNMASCFAKRGGERLISSPSSPSLSRSLSMGRSAASEGSGIGCAHRYEGAMGMKSYASLIPTATKSAFTRAANRKFGMTQSYLKSALRHVAGGATEEEETANATLEEEEEGDDDDEEEEGNISGSNRRKPNGKEEMGTEKKGSGAKGAKELNIPGVKIVSSSGTSKKTTSSSSKRSVSSTTTRTGRGGKKVALQKGDEKGSSTLCSTASTLEESAARGKRKSKTVAASKTEARGGTRTAQSASPSPLPMPSSSRSTATPSTAASRGRKRGRKLLDDEDSSDESSVESSSETISEDTD